MTTIKWGILGCGQIAQNFSKALKVVPNAELYASAARDGKRASVFAKEHGFLKSYGSYRELLADDAVDIIYIATPHSYHYAHALMCLEAGKHVLCEKAFTVNKAQLEVLIALAKKKKLFLMEALWTLAFPGTIKVKELIDSGIIGEPVSLEADFGFKAPIDPLHRLNNPELAGGVLLDIGIYPLLLSLFLFGKPTFIKAHSTLNNNKIDLATSILTVSKGGTMSLLHANIKANTPTTAKIFGTKGSIEFGKRWFTPSNITLKIEGKNDQIFEFSPLANGYEYEAIECVQSIIEGRTESEIVPFSFSLMLMEQMDKIRSMTGITYPEAIESIEKPYGLE